MISPLLVVRGVQCAVCSVQCNQQPTTVMRERETNKREKDFFNAYSTIVYNFPQNLITQVEKVRYFCIILGKILYQRY